MALSFLHQYATPQDREFVANLAKPPQAVIDAMEPVMMIMEQKNPNDWKSISAFMKVF